MGGHLLHVVEEAVLVIFDCFARFKHHTINSGAFGSSNKTVTFGNSVNMNEDRQAQPTQKTDSADGGTMPRGGISGRGRGRGF